jgi:hypothetical protein
MSKRTIDFSKANNTIPEGEYIVTVDESKLFTSETNGNEFLNWRFTIADGEHIGKKLFMRTWLTEKAMFMLVNLLGALGCEPDDKNNVEIDIEDTPDTDGGLLLLQPDVIGKMCTLKVILTSYTKDGKVIPKNEVKGAVVNNDSKQSESGTPSLF